ncbi:hypothetical protein AB6N23_12820, partial [Cellulomonas sp. 179-A 9B4 NHS]|uniref:hypothetical protein n=1 Tax=Cellulomonas sp. 179-A 9B4 NHS TaxID=3142379 RepID=UPI0039A36EF7
MTQHHAVAAHPTRHVDPVHPVRRADPGGGPPGASAAARRVLGLPDPVEESLARAAARRTLERVGGPVGLAVASAPTVAFVATDAAAGLGPALVALGVT